MKMTLMGTGTSHGIPVPGCSCRVCKSKDPKDTRFRCSAYVSDPCSVVIDTSPEFRLQAVRYGIKRIDAVLITHSHADHLHGLDDLRIYSHTNAVEQNGSLLNVETKGDGLPIYANSNTVRDIENRFDYIFKPVKEGGGKPKLKLIDNEVFGVENPILIGNLEVIPVPLLHGSLKDSGYILSEKLHGVRKNIAYLTDCNCIPESSFDMIKSIQGGVEHLIIDGLREKVHSTHFSFLEALAAAEKIGARHTWIIHVTHNMSHNDIQHYIDVHLDKFPGLKKIVTSGGSVAPGYDGLLIEA